MQQLKYILYSIRPSAGFMAGILAVAAYRPAQFELVSAIWLFIYFFSGSSFCFLANDLFDRKKDLANQKNRPIATGNLTPQNTIIASIFFAGIFWGLGILLGIKMFWLAIIATFSFILYSPVNSRTGLIANLFVSFWAVAPLWEIFMLRGTGLDLIYLSAFLFVVVVYREILLDWLDVDGDRICGKPSLPIKLSQKALVNLLLGFLLVATLFILPVYYFVEISISGYVLFVGAAVLTWIPFVGMRKKISRQKILYNVRFSHFSFAIFTIGIIIR